MNGPIALGPGPAVPLTPLKDLNEGPKPARKTSPIDRSKVDPQIVKAAEGMEAMFLDYMMQVMRKTVPENDLMPKTMAIDVYQGMLDTETAERAARQGGIGLADQIIAYLDSQRYTQMKGHAAPRPPQSGDLRTGGTHEGQPARK